MDSIKQISERDDITDSNELVELLKDSGKEFTHLNRLASYICETPYSLFNLLDHNFQYTASQVGDWPIQAIPKEETVCQFTIGEEELLVINDTLGDPRTKSIKEIADNDTLRFYAGVPIKSPSGDRVGAFCVIGDRPKDLSESQRQALIDLGKEVEARLELLKQKKALEAHNNRLQETSAFLENSTDLRWVLEPETFNIMQSDGTADILACSDSELIGKSLFDIIEQINIQNHLKQWISKQNNHSKLGIPVRLNIDSDEEKWLKLTFTKYNGSVLATGRDITEQYRAEEQLKKSLEEKEVLLSEVHHRVKNNLAVISGLLQLQRYQTEDENAINILRSSESRIISIAKIHELLYQSKDFNKVQLEPYLQELVSHLLNSYPLKKKKIDIDLKVSDLSINVNQALPVGLIVNELITNAIKHAFTGRDSGTITVLIIVREQNTVSIEVRDNGQGLDIHPSDMKEKGNLGFTLLATLIKQLDADLEINNKNGTSFQFTFQKDNKKGSVSSLINKP